jgi:hypothetical protein
MRIATTEQLYKKLEETMRGLVGFSAAGVAGVICYDRPSCL